MAGGSEQDDRVSSGEAPSPDGSSAPYRGDDSTPPVAVPGPDGAVPRPVRRTTPDLGIVAVAAGLVSLLARPFLMAGPTSRSVVLVAAIVALALGVWSLWGALRRSADWALAVAAIVAVALGAWSLWGALRRSGDWALALAAMLTGGLSLYLYVAYVTAPPGAT
jgi:hypothetical protein